MYNIKLGVVIKLGGVDIKLGVDPNSVIDSTAAGDD
jgi:hypothetical protein